MSIGSLDALSAYGRVPLRSPPAPREAAETAGGFGAMVQTMVETAGTALRTAETESAKQVAGKGDLVNVVTAIGAAEVALDTAVAVRDRMVSAYSEIMRMQI